MMMKTAPRMTKEEFNSFVLNLILNTYGPHNFAVEIGGKGKVVVLRWAMTGSAERTQKKALFFSNSPVMINAALASFQEWYKEADAYAYDVLGGNDEDPDAAYERHLENRGSQDAEHQDQWEAAHGCLDYWQAKAMAEGKSVEDIQDAQQPVLEVSADWQTKARGTNSAEYEIYAKNAADLGWQVKSFDEWVRS
ncbi:hypothetical protein fHeYen801_062 [Yersinia phage fHe-Yen8-01]|nr:hypothetical protein fHeYen801_062 [Yersinia phage fHe-Yen8-01]